MLNSIKYIIFLGFITLFSQLLFAQSQIDNFHINKVNSSDGRLSIISVEKKGSEFFIKGRVNKSPVSSGRRMFGYVGIEYLNKSGKILDRDIVKVYRRSPSKHTHSVFFKVTKSNLPVDTKRIRIKYNRYLKNIHSYS